MISKREPVRLYQRCPVGDFVPPKAGLVWLLDGVAIASWYRYHLADRAWPKAKLMPVIRVNIINRWYKRTGSRLEIKVPEARGIGGIGPPVARFAAMLISSLITLGSIAWALDVNIRFALNLYPA